MDEHWSKYTHSLDSNAQERYKKKLEYADGDSRLPDPYFIDRNEWRNDPSMWPDLTYGDIYMYLINMPGMFSSESMKAFKSLDAYRFAVCGHVQEVIYKDITDTPFCLLKSKVIPSMRINNTPHEPWVYLIKEGGAVYCAHCTCMAGLGEVCSHVAALLFKVEIAVKMGLTKKSSTSSACQWNASFRKQLEPFTLQEMTEKGFLRGNRKKPISSMHPSGRAALPGVDVLTSLHDVCPSAAFFSSIPGFRSEETDSDSDLEDYIRYPQLMTTLFDEENETLSDTELSVKTNFILSNLQCSSEQCNNLELATRNQAVSQLWYNHRKGRITGTKAHDVRVRRDTTNPDNLVKRIVGYNTFNISSKIAVKYGTDNESEARRIYTKQQQAQHQHFTCRQSGFLVDSSNQFLGASADGVVHCDCCGAGVLEIKCPFTHRSHTVQEAVSSDRSFCLGTNLCLKTGHRYYTQVQLQMHVNNVKYCDFVIFSKPNDTCVYISRLSYNAIFCKELVEVCSSYWKSFVLPELVSGRLDKASHLPDTSTDTAIPVTVCICGQPEYGKMIKCGNVDCEIEWFHYPCVHVKRKPVRKWLCPRCK